jgi:protein-disulfide isomerase
MDKRFWASVVIIVVILGGVFVATSHKQSDSGGTTNASAGATNHVKGEGKAGVTLVEYGDYECPACYQYYPVLNQVYDKYKSQIHFQFRNFPLTSLHKNAFAGARAAEAADLQGKFWEMHDTLYQNQDPNGQSGWVAAEDPLSTYFVQFAQQLGINTDKFKADYRSSAVNNRINKDIDAATSLKFSATPSFVVDGQAISSPNPTVDAFSKVIDKEIANKSGH